MLDKGEIKLQLIFSLIEILKRIIQGQEKDSLMIVNSCLEKKN